MHTEDRGCGRLGREAWGLVCQCRKDETQGIGQWEGWQGHVWQRQLGENESHLSQASYSCAHRCAPPPKTYQPDSQCTTDTSGRGKSRLWWALGRAVVGCRVYHLPDGSELAPGASPRPPSPHPWGWAPVAGRGLAPGRARSAEAGRPQAGQPRVGKASAREGARSPRLPSPLSGWPDTSGRGATAVRGRRPAALRAQGRPRGAPWGPGQRQRRSRVSGGASGRRSRRAAEWGWGRCPGRPAALGAVGGRAPGRDAAVPTGLGERPLRPARAPAGGSALPGRAKEAASRAGAAAGAAPGHMGGGRSRRPGRALPGAGQTAAAGAAAAARPPSVPGARVPPGPGRAARQVSGSRVSARP